jgi:hypothetical protein
LGMAAGTTGLGVGVTTGLGVGVTTGVTGLGVTVGGVTGVGRTAAGVTGVALLGTVGVTAAGGCVPPRP